MLNHRGRIRFLYFLSALCVAGFLTVESQGQALPVADWIAARSFHAFDPIAESPDGGTMAYVLNENAPPDQAARNPDADKSLQKIWLLDLKSGTSHSLTGPESDSSPAWSADGQFLAFCRGSVDSSGHRQRGIWIWQAASGAFRQVLAVSQCDVRGFQWSSDSRRLYVKTQSTEAAMPAPVGGDPTPQPLSVRVFKSALTAGAVDESVQAWNIDHFYDLVAVEVRSGRVTPLLKRSRIAMFWLSPNGTNIALALTTRFEKPDSSQLLYDLVALDLATSQIRPLAAGVRLGPVPITVSWSPESDRIAYREAGMLAGGGVHIVSLDQPAKQVISGNEFSAGCWDCSASLWGAVVMPPLWERDGKHLFFANQGTIWKVSAANGTREPLARFPGKQIELLESRENLVPVFGGPSSTVVVSRDNTTRQVAFSRVDLNDGTIAELYRGDFECLGPFSFLVRNNPDSLVYMSETASSPVDLWTLAASSKQPVRLTTINSKLMNYSLGSSRLISWRSLDGEALHGALLLPPAYDAAKRYPLVVGVYPSGYLSQGLNKFGLQGCYTPINAQLLATRGFAVLCPDAPVRVGTPVYDVAQTVLPGVDKVIEMGIADPDRIGVMGNSNGGYGTLALITQSRRFKAAVVSSGFGDLFGMYGEMLENGSSLSVSVMEEGMGRMGGTPWEVRSRYLENSPFFYLDRVHTPVLLLQGAADRTTEVFLADQTFVGLRRLGVPALYARYPNEGHVADGWSSSNHEDYLLRVIDWFETYLRQ